ncbi:hypothetical protein QE210_12245 [Arsenophonus nasoniae]|uniref:Uncharacterized protein n=2 Tax=Arsenophonus nasoniae TaxID=638 RepID=A0AA95GN26_9GAMM|nr:hypothetical protein QE210_12245 [Arsenophonus nasoniae]
MYRPVVLVLKMLGLHLNIMQHLNESPPYGIGSTTRGLTTMLTKVTVMALYKSTQTHPKFTDTYWIIRLDYNIPYGKVSLTRRERRLFYVLFKDDRLVWLGRKPITPQSIIACSTSHAQEVAHA